MRSVRLGSQLERELQALSRRTGQPMSEIIRDALRRRCRELNGDRLDARLADVIGTVDGSSRGVRKSGRQFTGIIKRRAGRRR